MSLYIYSYPSLHINPGGPAYKTAMIYKFLREYGLDVIRFDMWDDKVQYSEDDLFYIFTANISTYSLAANLLKKKINYIVNPIFYSNHSPSVIKSYRFLEQPLRKIFPRSISDYDITEFICKNSQHILPNTEAEKKLLQAAFNLKNSNFSVIHNGVESRFAQATPYLFYKTFGLKDFVLYTGHLGPVRKNGLNIVKAMQKVDVPCVIIADIIHNAEGDRCRREIEKSPNIKYLGWFDHNDPLLESAYAACHTFILPTRYETPGRAALEAGLAGANIVITPKGGTREYFADHAFYPNPSDINSIADKIEESLNSPRQEILKNRIMNNYIWEIIAENTKNLIRRLL
jgi:glycosyltransferase involved in cell wall biosynthesis